MRHLIDAETLLARLADPGLRVLDARFELTEPAAGRRAYAAGHVPGAVYVDLDEDLAAPPRRHGGRHPLPDLTRFARTMGARGIGNEHEVVVYDQSGTMYGARAWWLLRYAGHDRVRVLDGGWTAFLEAGGEPELAVSSHPPARFAPRPRAELVVGRDDVRRLVGDCSALLIDVRAPERYRGEVEPLDPRAGHIPSAINLPYEDNQEGGRFLAPERLAERYAAARGKDTVVAYCGSGVSAAHAVLAMAEVGLAARLYPGSWSDWCSYEDAEIALGEEGTE